MKPQTFISVAAFLVFGCALAAVMTIPQARQHMVIRGTGRGK